jgi:hypothetical protein
MPIPDLDQPIDAARVMQESFDTAARSAVRLWLVGAAEGSFGAETQGDAYVRSGFSAVDWSPPEDDSGIDYSRDWKAI